MGPAGFRSNLRMAESAKCGSPASDWADAIVVDVTRIADTSFGIGPLGAAGKLDSGQNVTPHGAAADTFRISRPDIQGHPRYRRSAGRYRSASRSMGSARRGGAHRSRVQGRPS
jgi:hypothetical protein